MKMFLISDNVDTYTGMRLAGVDGVVVHERSELHDALQKVMDDKSIGIVLLTENSGGNFPILSMRSSSNENYRCLSKFLTVTEPAVKKTLSHLM